MNHTKQAMVRGDILPQLIFFALPLLGSSLVQQLYNTVDLLFVGNFAGKTAAAAVGSSSLIFTCLIGLFTGIAVGVGIVIAHAWGAGRRTSAMDAAHTALAIGVLGSLLLTVLGILSAEHILRLIQTPDTVLAEAAVYVRVYFLSMLPMVIYNMGASILRSCGESRAPFYILIAGGLANVAADAVLVAWIPLGVTGAAAATSLSQLLSAVLMLGYLFGRRSPISMSFRRIRVHRRLLSRILSLGLPAGIQSVTITLSNILVQAVINSYGEDAVAAYAAYFRIEGLLYLPIMACGQAITTFVGQNYGAGEYGRIQRGVAWGLALGCGITILFAGVLLISPGSVIGLFLQDGDVISMGVSIMTVTFPLYWIYSVLEILGGSLRGMGFSHISMLTVLTGLCLVRIILLGVIQASDYGFRAIACVYPVTWGFTAIVFVVLFFAIMRRVSRLHAPCEEP